MKTRQPLPVLCHNATLYRKRRQHDIWEKSVNRRYILTPIILTTRLSEFKFEKLRGAKLPL